MKAVILAGGFGTRISEESHLKPKPMVDIGDHPILWHIMKIYSHYGFNEFIICLGYKSYLVKDYFANYFLHTSDVTFDFRNGGSEAEIHNSVSESWKVSLVYTGQNTMTGGRIKRIAQYIGDDEDFFVTYGDGVTDMDIRKLYDFHKASGKIATMTAVQPVGRFGSINIDESQIVRGFHEKPKGDGGWINGGFFVFKNRVFDYIAGDHSILEDKPIHNLVKDGELMAYQYKGFWHPMDTLRDKNYLEELWQTNSAPWKLWR